MQIRVLGHVEASVEDDPVALGGAKQRAVLAMLVLEANRTVSTEHLIEGLWGEAPPASAPKMLQNYVWRLRTVLADDSGAQIVTHGRGYQLRIDPELVDVRRLERLVTEANRADGRRTDAAREALALFRGDPLADLADQPFAGAEIRRLEELRQTATELALDADMAAGRHQLVIGEIEARLAENPLRERLHGLRMLALYRGGRQADALEAYRQARSTLVDEVGLEPGPELRRLHEAILQQDASLDAEPFVAELPRELDAASAPPLIGRDGELRRLQARWERAAKGAGALMTVIGGYGMGKTRLAAALALEAHRGGADVRYAAGTGAPEAALAAVAQVRDARRPTLLVLDDADRAPDQVHAAVRALAPTLVAVPALVLATGQESAVLARLGSHDSVALEPLDADAVRLIAGLYAPSGGNGAVPVEALLTTSRGVARRVHEAAGEWARQEATRRVDAVADRAASGRSEARALGAELAGSVVDLQSARERSYSVAPDGAEGPVVCPYKGLAAFEADDAEMFFGRERLVAELVARLVGASLLAVVGPSGSGKSSAVRAGLLPTLAGGVLPGSDGWAQELIRPGEHPLRELRRARERLADRRGVLAVDQFEELFTACRDERERSEFVAALVSPGSATVVVLALRADFYGQCATYPELSALLGDNQVLVGPMSSEELRRAIERPAARAGLGLEAGLVDRLLADCEGEPGALPLLSTALLELWQRRDGRRLHLSGYERSGGVRGAVARLAETAYARLDRDQQDGARRILLRLADDDVHGEAVRRRVSLEELGDARDDDTQRVLDVLAGSRMIIVGEAGVEVAHEALLREWPRLRGWLEEDTEGRRLHRQLSLAARQWNQGGRDRADLYRGARLASALEWRADHEPELNEGEREFLGASQAAGERARRRVQLAFAGVVGLLVLATVAAVLAVNQRGRARDQALVADAQRLGARAQGGQGLDRSLLLARQGVALADVPATRDDLLAVLRRSPAAIAVMRGDGDDLTAIALHPDGRTLALGDDDGTVTFVDAVSGRRLGKPHQTTEYGDPITSLAFSPDGTRLAGAERAAVHVFDGRTRRYLRGEDNLHGRYGVVSGIGSGDISAHFSPDSHVLAAQFRGRSGPILRWNAPGNAGVADQSKRRLADSWIVLGSLGSGARLVTTSEDARETVIRDANTLRSLRRLPAYGSVAVMSSDGRAIAYGARDGSVSVLDVRTGALHTARARHLGAVTAMRFDLAGERLVTAGADERFIVWDPARATAIQIREARGSGPVRDLAVAPDGRTAYSAGGDGTLIAWDLTGERSWERPFGAGTMPRSSKSLATATSGSHFAVVDARGFVDVFDSRTLRPTGRVRPGGKEVTAAAVSPDGRTLATMAVHSTYAALQLWDVRTRRPLGEPSPAHEFGASALSFSADGRWLASGGVDHSVRLWDLSTRRAEGSAVLENVLDFSILADVDLSPDGSMLAVTRTNRLVDDEGVRTKVGLQILSVPSFETLREVTLPRGTVGRFSSDGRTLTYGDRDGRVWTLDTRTWKPRGRPVDAGSPIRSVNQTADGRLLATTSDDGTGRLWDTVTRRPIGTALSGLAGEPIGAVFIPGGTHLAVVHDRGGVVWDLRPGSWTRHACAVAGRTLTRSEWETELPQHDYAPACASE